MEIGKRNISKWKVFSMINKYHFVPSPYCHECKCSPTNGLITSPRYPGLYALTDNRSWLIQVISGELVELNFIFFDVGFERPDCRFATSAKTTWQ